LECPYLQISSYSDFYLNNFFKKLPKAIKTNIYNGRIILEFDVYIYFVYLNLNS